MAKGLLLVTMEPPAGLEDEFNDWYDTEHFPQRRGLPGFESASRWVCLQGWPRWIALYDMDSPAAVETPEYRAVSGANSTPWSRRLLPRTIGRERIVCEQLSPGNVAGLPPAQVTRLVVAQYPAIADDAATHALSERAAALPGLLQLRLFKTIGTATPDSWVVAEFSRPHPADRFIEAFAELGGVGARRLNVYAPYNRNPS
jgi:hypothetical protein